MARILFGVMGDALGHVNQALALAQEMPGHEFLFMGGGRTHLLAGYGYTVESLPMMATRYCKNRVDVAATVAGSLGILLWGRRVLRRVTAAMAAFKPALVLTAYEFFTPLAARRLGIPCVSVDNNHFLTKCTGCGPSGQALSRLMFELSQRLFYSHADTYFINTFFQPQAKNPLNTEVFPPLLRESVQRIKSSHREHALVYQTSATFTPLLHTLEEVPTKFFVYGCDPKIARGNIVFRKFSEKRFLEDLASSRYVVTNGGHNVISEALYYGKPVLSFPIHLAYEQYVNAVMLAKLGFGAYSFEKVPEPEFILRFEKQLDRYRAAIRQRPLVGNAMIRNRLEDLLSGKWTADKRV